MAGVGLYGKGQKIFVYEKIKKKKKKGMELRCLSIVWSMHSFVLVSKSQMTLICAKQVLY